VKFEFPVNVVSSILMYYLFVYMIISLESNSWNALFGGGNIPTFVLASICALASGIVATLNLPNLSSSFKLSGFHFG
jgi:solute carrier family 45, member 1/2/4